MASSFSCATLAFCVVIAVILQAIGVSLFAIGFFPVKPTLPGRSGPESYRMPSCRAVAEDEDEEMDLSQDQLRSIYREMSEISLAFDRLILMVIDGLPAEFLLGTGDGNMRKAMIDAMPYTQSLLSTQRAIAYHAKAAPPTVTMPRLKAMISGAIGGFLDVAFNFNTHAFLDDNILDQFHQIGWKLVMLGDDTWMKLFPRLFMRQDGVSSFYVKDTSEVDFNVSRHLDAELNAKDWSLLILHYLGLDHVGHTGGRSSILMDSKLNEMDEVIKTIHQQGVLRDKNFDKHTLLVVVSDHGMTDNGNHGGSSYEETDALALFVGLEPGKRYAPNVQNNVFQVDIAPTLALMFGVPIPKNNVGVLLMDTFLYLTDEQKLRALELNSWQLLRLLEAHMPGLLCENIISISDDVHGLELEGKEHNSNAREKLSHLYSKALASKNTRIQHKGLGALYNNSDDFASTVTLYHEFLTNASQWLSHRATDKPMSLLVSGVAILLLSCALLINLSLRLFKEVHVVQTQSNTRYKFKRYGSFYDMNVAFVFLGILLHVLSLGASSMVEEEQYTWNYLASSLYVLFLFTTIQSSIQEQVSRPFGEIIGEGTSISKIIGSTPPQWKCLLHYVQLTSVFVVLVCGRILRGWHQGGVNWSTLPDISKWLDQSGTSTIKCFQIISIILVMISSSVTLSMARLKRGFYIMVLIGYYTCAFLVLLHLVRYRAHNSGMPVSSATFVAQVIYIVIGMTVAIILLASPWIFPVCNGQACFATKTNSNFDALNTQCHKPLGGIQDCAFLIGMTYATCWCLLQFLLQQPNNAVPLFLLLLQVLASMTFFRTVGAKYVQWVEVAAVYFLGMAGHFALGNSNNLATIDVAGAFIGISSHSTLLSGILMFIITYASPLLAFFSLMMFASPHVMSCFSGSQKPKMSSILLAMIGFPCLLPLVLNSFALTAFTIILSFMSNHLFVWSVFSPKFLYVCAATVSTYVGVGVLAATGTYICFVFNYRTKMLGY